MSPFMILLIDNYDSFTFNLYQALAEPSREVQVVRNDRISAEEVLRRQPSHVVLSPGPKTPNEAGICLDLIQKAAGAVPILGVCLGHQAIAQAFGGRIVPAQKIVHGKTSAIFHRGKGLFKNIPNPFEATRYHSLAVCPENLPECLEITARSEEGEIMALQHRQHLIFGVQFHPESVLTRQGNKLIENFLQNQVA